MSLVTTKDVDDKEFYTQWFRGYDMNEVERFLDTISANLQSYEEGSPDKVALSSKSIREKHIDAVRFRAGYDMVEVDDFIDDIADTFAYFEDHSSAVSDATSRIPAIDADLRFMSRDDMITTIMDLRHRVAKLSGQ
jgi:DivIVA domain-containing protein